MISVHSLMKCFDVSTDFLPISLPVAGVVSESADRDTRLNEKLANKKS